MTAIEKHAGLTDVFEKKDDMVSLRTRPRGVCGFAAFVFKVFQGLQFAQGLRENSFQVRKGDDRVRRRPPVKLSTCPTMKCQQQLVDGFDESLPDLELRLSVYTAWSFVTVGSFWTWSAATAVRRRPGHRVHLLAFFRRGTKKWRVFAGGPYLCTEEAIK